MLNNPLNATDPSGYFLSLIVGAIMTFMEVKLTTMIVGMAATAFVETIATGGSFGDALKAGFIGGLSAWAFSAIGASENFGYAVGDGTQQLAMNALGNGMVGGIMSVLQGGKFGHGFLSAGVSAFAKPGIRKGFGTSKGAMPARVLSRAVVGGTLSKVTGGKFANGARSAAFSQLFNEEQTLARERTGQNRRATQAEKNRACSGRPCMSRNTDDGKLNSFGVSAELSVVTPLQSNGGGVLGVNIQYIEDEGLGIYVYSPSAAEDSSGFSVGVSFQVNEARGTGTWSGDFNNTDLSLGPVSIGTFSTPTREWAGTSLGGSIGTPVGATTNVTNFTKIWGHDGL